MSPTATSRGRGGASTGVKIWSPATPVAGLRITVVRRSGNLCGLPAVTRLVRRSLTARLLILAFLAAFFAPLRAGWACPDGTPCVAAHGNGYVCAGDHCRTASSCCEVSRRNYCKHGAVPARADSPVVSGPDHCLFSVAARERLTAVTEPAGKLIRLKVPMAVSPVLTVTPPVASPVWLADSTAGCRPPPLLPSGPSRAPPSA